MYFYEYEGVVEIEKKKDILTEKKWRKLMVNNVIPQNGWISQLALINSNMSYLIKKLLDTKWKEFKVKSIN